MIVKGKSHSGQYKGKGGGNLGTYLLKEKNTRAEVLDIRGAVDGMTLAETVDLWRALDAKTGKPLYHASLNPDPNDRELTREEWETAVAVFEKAMGFENQPRALILHEYQGRTHLHMVYSRVDDDGKALSDSWNYRKHDGIAREIETTLGLIQTPSHFQRDGPRVERAPEEWEFKQAERLKKDEKATKADIRAIFEASGTGQEFKAGLEKAGYTLAQGDSRDFVVMDSEGGIYNPGRITKTRAAAFRDFMADVDREALPSAAEAREQQEEQERQRREAERRKREEEDERSRRPEEGRQTEAPDPGLVRAWRATYKDILATNRAAPAPALTPGGESQAAALAYLHARAEWANERAAAEPRPMHPDDHAAALARRGDDTAARWLAKFTPRADIREGFEAAKDGITERAQEPVQGLAQRDGGQDEGLWLRPAAQDAGDYLALCQNPLSNLRLWLDEDRRRRGEGVFLPSGPGAGLADDDGLRPARGAEAPQAIDHQERDVNRWLGKLGNRAEAREGFQAAREDITERRPEPEPERPQARDARAQADPEKLQDAEAKRKAFQERIKHEAEERLAKDAEENRRREQEERQLSHAARERTRTRDL